jgi:OHCU decarboxylase
MIGLQQLNTLPPAQFVEALAGIFEHSAWVAQRSARRRPFDSRLDLLDAMRNVVSEATPAEQLALINAHPKLGARGRTRQQLTQASGVEQRGAGLDACNDEEFAHLERINASYLARFDFPFILAVRGYDPPAIIAQMQRRLTHERQEEIGTAIQQIGLIASYRLADTVASHPQSEAKAMLGRLPGSHPAALITEWMRAASLSVWSDDNGILIGTLRSAAPADSMILGLHRDVDSGSLCYGDRVSWIVAIAVIQHLKERAHELPYDLSVIAPVAESVHSRPVAQVLAQAQLLHARVPVLASSAAVAGRELVRATRALEEYLLHTRCHE